MTSAPRSLPGVVDVSVIRGGAASADAAPDLVIEVPHGATRTEDFTSLEAQLTSALPKDLIDFFYVNTDAGAFELGLAAAHALVAADPLRTVMLLRCRIPRTFIDCNRRIDASPAEFKEGKVTPGLMPWITTEADRNLLRDRYEAYVGVVREVSAMPGPTGAMLLLHSYAPRTVDVEVDAQIVENLHRAYQPEVEATWPLRPEIDVIARGTDGVDYAPAAVVTALREGMKSLGLGVADSATYPMHPSTLAFEHVKQHPGRALCLEFRRDLLADPFSPFIEMKIGAEKVARLAGPLAAALRRWW